MCIGLSLPTLCHSRTSSTDCSNHLNACILLVIHCFSWASGSKDAWAIQNKVTELNWTSFWWTDQWSSRASPVILGWRVRVRSHVVTDAVIDGDWCRACALLLAHWAVRQKLNSVSSVQFSYFVLYALQEHCKHEDLHLMKALGKGEIILRR